MSSDSYIHVEAVSKHFGSVRAVNEVSVDIAQGEFFSLLGASGCGKTTLLRMLAGFEAPTKGEIYIDDQPMSEVPPHLRPTNMVFQNYAIFPHLNVRGNVAYGLRKERLSKEQLKHRVDEALAQVKLSGFHERRANELSGGQRQRVALARALIKRPKVLLLDEPLGALDKKLREEMQLELRALQRSVGITFVFVTHDQEEALTMSDRIAVMSDGRVLQIATPKSLYERPNSIEVADFIGQMNFLDGTVEALDNGYATVRTGALGTVRAPLPDETGGATPGGFARAGAAVKVAIRPEKLHLRAQRPAEERNTREGTLRNTAYLGDLSHYYVDVGDAGETLEVAELEAGGAFSESMQSSVWLTWADESLVLLPPG